MIRKIRTNSQQDPESAQKTVFIACLKATIMDMEDIKSKTPRKPHFLAQTRSQKQIRQVLI